MVSSTKTLSRQLARLYATKLPTPISTTTLQQCSVQSTYDSLLRTALALQHLAHVRLAVRASNYIDVPPVNPTYCQNRDIDLPTTTDFSYPQRSSICIQRLDRPQLPATIVQLHPTTRPTSATCNDRPASPTTRPTSATCNDRPASPTTQPTSVTRNDRPAASNNSSDLSYLQRSSSFFNDSTDLSYLQRSSSCTSTTRPTFASRNDRPAASYDSTHIGYQQRSSSRFSSIRPYQLPTSPI